MQKNDSTLLIKNVILDGEKTNIRIKGSIIIDIGKEIEETADDVIDCNGRKAAILPMINGHTHSAMSLLRGFGDDLPLMEWLKTKIWPIEDKMTPDDIYWGTKFACLEMIRSGTIFFNEMYMFPEAAMMAVKEMGIRSLIGLVMIDVPPAKDMIYTEKKYRELVTEQNELVRLSVSPHSIYTVSKDNLKWAGEFAKNNDIILHTHVAETEEEERNSQRRYGMSPVELLDDIGFLFERTILAHGVWLSDKDIDILAKRGCTLVYNPSSNMKLAIGKTFPYKKIKRAGINVALGTDGSASNNNLDMFEEMKVGSLLQKHEQNNPTALPSNEIFDCATKNGSKAFGLDYQGIRVGGSSDIILIDLDYHTMVPGHDLISDLVYSASGSAVSDLICNGQIIMRDCVIKGEEKIKNEFIKRVSDLKRLVK